MGRVSCERGIGPANEKVKAVYDAREPSGNVGKVRSFLGLVNVSARYISDLATTAEALRRLTRQGKMFRWGAEQKKKPFSN